MKTLLSLLLLFLCITPCFANVDDDVAALFALRRTTIPTDPFDKSEKKTDVTCNCDGASSCTCPADKCACDACFEWRDFTANSKTLYFRNKKVGVWYIQEQSLVMDNGNTYVCDGTYGISKDVLVEKPKVICTPMITYATMPTSMSYSSGGCSGGS